MAYDERSLLRKKKTQSVNFTKGDLPIQKKEID